MIYPAILDRKYQEYYPFVKQVADRVKATLLNFCEDQGYALTSRIKTIESLAEKIEAGRFKKWSQLDDLFACTVIIPNLLKEAEVRQFCQEKFKVNRIIKRGQNKKPPDTFRFDSTRIYASLKRPPEQQETDNFLSIYSITFEIQIKSAFEHAWAVSTHDLVYKSSEIDWKKQRLAAQIKATVEQLDMLIIAFDQASSMINESDYPEIKNQQKLAKLTKDLFEQNKIPEELKPKDMTRFCHNLYNMIKWSGKEDKISKIVKFIKTKVSATSHLKIPRSLSLLQYFLAILVENKEIDFPLKNYSYHITDELITLYPIFQRQEDNSYDTVDYEN